MLSEWARAPGSAEMHLAATRPLATRQLAGTRRARSNRSAERCLPPEHRRAVLPPRVPLPRADCPPQGELQRRPTQQGVEARWEPCPGRRPSSQRKRPNSRQRVLTKMRARVLQRRSQLWQRRDEQRVLSLAPRHFGSAKNVDAPPCPGPPGAFTEIGGPLTKSFGARRAVSEGPSPRGRYAVGISRRKNEGISASSSSSTAQVGNGSASCVQPRGPMRSSWSSRRH